MYVCVQQKTEVDFTFTSVPSHNILCSIFGVYFEVEPEDGSIQHGLRIRELLSCSCLCCPEVEHSYYTSSSILR